jgi:lia operon protein LiaF
MRNTGLLFFGSILVLIGLASMAGTLFQVNIWGLLWPSLLILLGIWLLARPYLMGPGKGLDIAIIGDIRRSGTWQATNEELWTFVGDIDLNLTQADLPVGVTRYRILGFVADVDVQVPEGVGVAVSTIGFVTGLHLLGQKHDRFLIPFEWKSDNYDAAERKVFIETVFFVNDLKVKRL